MSFAHHFYARTRSSSQWRVAGMWYCFRLLPGAIVAGLLVLLLSASPARAVAPDHMPLQTGVLLLETAAGESHPAVMQSSNFDVSISGMVAVVTLTQHFANESSDWVEGVYSFPLPDEAAVRSMELIAGERRIVGRVRERQLAQQQYRQAREEGKRASLVEQQRPNLFTNRISNIAPGESVSVRLEYVQPVLYRQGEFSLRLPTTLTPRYMPGRVLEEGAGNSKREILSINDGSGWAQSTDQVPDAALISPFLHASQGSDTSPLNAMTLQVSLDMGLPLADFTSLYHEVAIARQQFTYQINLVDGRAEMDRDVLLSWRVASGSEPQAAWLSETRNGKHYGLLMIVPPETAPVPVARELVFVIDTSGSMAGDSIRQAKSSLRRALRRLSSDDQFNVIAFDSRARRLYPQAMPASQQRIAQALSYVDRLEASGGTEMLAALQMALSDQSELHSDRLRQVVFVTDGAVGNEQTLFEAINQSLGQSRLFTVGIGSAPNSWFMRASAELGRGTHTHIGSAGEVAERMDALFDAMAAPVATDIDIQWPAEVDSAPARIPDLYHGDPVQVVARLPQPLAPGSAITLQGVTGGQAWERAVTVSASRDSHEGVASLWARRKIRELLDGRAQGADEASVKSSVLALALEHQLLSPYTSFVAVDETPVREPGSTLTSRPVPNTAPRGQAPQTYAWPSTATSAPLSIYLASVFLLSAILVWRLARDEVTPAAHVCASRSRVAQTHV